MEKGVRLEGVTGMRYMYHDPCHTPMKTYEPLKVVNALMNDAQNGRIEKNDRCCGESGHASRSRAPTSRPRCASARKRRSGPAPRSCALTLRVRGAAAPVKVLTSCPSCLQGLKRYNDDAAVDADYIVVEIARHVLGGNWMAEYVARANAGGIERVLV